MVDLGLAELQHVGGQAVKVVELGQDQGVGGELLGDGEQPSIDLDQIGEYVLQLLLTIRAFPPLQTLPHRVLIIISDLRENPLPEILLFLRAIMHDDLCEDVER